MVLGGALATLTQKGDLTGEQDARRIHGKGRVQGGTRHPSDICFATDLYPRKSFATYQVFPG